MVQKIVLRDPDACCWYEYRQPISVLCASDLDDVVPMLAEIESRVTREQVYAAGFVSYEAAAAFDAALSTHMPGELPLLCFGLFKERIKLDELGDVGANPLGAWQPSEGCEAHAQAVSELRRHIGAGDVYQVNYTTRWQAQGEADFAAFVRIAEDALYGAYIEAEHFNIVSASPELFFRLADGELTCQPMKGTAARGTSAADDMKQRAWLQSSVKNCAENLMITDMVRNDLGRVADVGSVHVPDLFSVTQYPTVWQMTSTVRATIEELVSKALANTSNAHGPIVEIFKALFPGASITGAPKRASMSFIEALETTPREIYTGAIGVIEPSGRALFNIAIRTAWTNKRSNTSLYGVGGGIVWDSEANDEYRELEVKTKVLDSARQSYALFETMRWEPEAGVYLRDAHFARLAASARYMGYSFDLNAAGRLLDEQLWHLPDTPHRVRMLLKTNGKVEVDCAPVEAKPVDQLIALARTPVDSANPLLYHKTVNRSVYECAAEQVGAEHEALLFNQLGYVTETAIANIVYRRQGELFTPPVSDGLLPGTLRGSLLEAGEVSERSLHVDELGDVQDWFLVNALRGWRNARLVPLAD